MNLLEKFVTICYRAKGEDFHPYENYFAYTMTGAILMDLASQDYIKIENGYLRLLKHSATDHPVYNMVIDQIKNSKKERKLKSWISRIYQKNWRIKRDVLEECNKRGLIRIERKKFLNLIPYRKYKLNSTQQRAELIRQMRDVALHNKEGNAELYSLLGLIHASQSYKAIARDRGDERIVKKKVKQLINNDLIGGAVDAVIQEVNVAIIATIVASTTATVTSASSG
jgi:golgi phosphoprotein 3